MYRLPHSLGGDGCSSRDTPSPHGRRHGTTQSTPQDDTFMYKSSPTREEINTRYWDQSLAGDIWYGRRFSERGDIAYARCLICDVKTICGKTADGYLCMGIHFQNLGDLRCTVMEQNCYGSTCYCCDWADRKEEVRQKERLDRANRYTPRRRDDESNPKNTSLVQEE